jgi:hypothetical protein
MFKNFDYIANLKYGISEKSDGAMELANADLSGADRRRIFFEKQGIAAADVINAGLAHSFKVAKVNNNDRGKIIAGTDALVTANHDLLLTITVADCFPVYFYNPKIHTVALAHSGWRGTAQNIVGEVIKALSGTAADLFVGIGPGIQACHFEIKDDVLEKFLKYPEAVIYRNNKIFVDLPKIISSQLTAAGVLSKNIENCVECTFCQKEKYFSFRRDKPKSLEAILAYIMLLK